MKKYKNILCLVICVVLVALSGCGGGGDSDKLAVKVIAPTGTVDTVDPQIRLFMKNAEQYVVGDYTGTMKTVDDLGNRPVAVNFQWSFDKDSAFEKALVIYSKNKDLSNPTKQSVNKIRAGDKKQNVKVFNLETGVKYYWAIEAEKDGKIQRSEIFEFDTAEGPRILSIGGVKNARDMGGWKTTDGRTVKQGLIFRTANLNSVTDSSENVLFGGLGLKTELDLRNPATEDVYSPLSLLKDDFNYINISSRSYVKYWNDPYTAAHAMRVFTLPDNYPILFHCAAGADRTGALGFCLNALCGVDEKDLVIDYELTPGRFRRGSNDGKNNYDFPAFMQMLHTFPGDTVKDKVYGFFLNKGKLSQMELYNITAMMLTDSAVFTAPPKAAVKVQDGKAVFEIDPRSSGSVKSVTANGAEYQFEYGDGQLTVTVGGAGLTNAVATFDDGAQMPLVWE